MTQITTSLDCDGHGGAQRLAEWRLTPTFSLRELLIEAIPRLSRSKEGVLDFFRGCGVPYGMMADLRQQVAADRNSISKFAIARKILVRINNGGDRTLGQRRQILQRVSEFEDFSTCWESDQLKAKGLVAEIRKVINVKDSFTRMRQAEEKQRHEMARKRQQAAEAEQRRRTQRGQLRRRLAGLSSMTNPQERGHALERVLNELFALDGLSIRESFTIRMDDGHVGEQVDGLVGLDGQLIMAEFKWHSEPIGRDEMASHLVRLYGRPGVRGLFVSASPFTQPAIEDCKRSLTDFVIVLAEVNELLMLLENPDASLADWLRQKATAAVIDRKPLFRPDLRPDPVPAV